MKLIMRRERINFEFNPEALETLVECDCAWEQIIAIILGYADPLEF